LGVERPGRGPGGWGVAHHRGCGRHRQTAAGTVWGARTRGRAADDQRKSAGGHDPNVSLRLLDLPAGAWAGPAAETSLSTCRRSRYNSRSDTAVIMPDRRRPPITAAQQRVRRSGTPQAPLPRRQREIPVGAVRHGDGSQTQEPGAPPQTPAPLRRSGTCETAVNSSRRAAGSQIGAPAASR